MTSQRVLYSVNYRLSNTFMFAQGLGDAGRSGNRADEVVIALGCFHEETQGPGDARSP